MMFIVFLIGYIVLNYDPFKVINEKKTFEKDFIGSYILKYPNKAELHNKGIVYEIDFDLFFERYPKLIGKIKIEERPQIDEINLNDELEFRKKIKTESEEDFWKNRKKK